MGQKESEKPTSSSSLGRYVKEQLLSQEMTKVKKSVAIDYWSLRDQKLKLRIPSFNCLITRGGMKNGKKTKPKLREKEYLSQQS